MKTLTKLFEKVEPRGEGERRFFNLHRIKLQSLVPGTTDDEKLFKATEVKTFDRPAHRMGYKPGSDIAEFEREQDWRGSPQQKGHQEYTEDYEGEDLEQL